MPRTFVTNRVLNVLLKYDNTGRIRDLKFQCEWRTPLANTAQAKKRARQAETRRQHNAGMRSMFRTYVKRIVYAVEAGDKAKAEDAYKTAIPVIDGMVSKGLIHKNKAARHKSRLNSTVRAM